MNTDKNNTERLSYLAHELRLCNFSKKCGAVIHQAQVDKPSYLDFLCSLFTQELADREAYKRRRLHSLAQLPRDCDLDNFDFSHPSGITKPQMKELRELAWLDQIYNILLMGPCGTGNVHHNGEPGLDNTPQGTLRIGDGKVQPDHKTPFAGDRRHHALPHAERRSCRVL